VIGLDEAALQPICREADVEMANINSPGQIVLSGARAGVEKAKGLAEAAGARKAVLLKVAGAYHSRLMAPAARELESVWRALPMRAPAAVPVLANATGVPHGDAAAVLRDVVRQVTSCVQWVRDVEWMRAHGITEYIELGPGKVLNGLIKRIDTQSALHYIQDRASLDGTVNALVGRGDGARG
jgi:[acyl-carrier-protein] S-malonyltransferase